MPPSLKDAARTARPAAEVEAAIQGYRAPYEASGRAPEGDAQVANVVQYYDLVTDFYEWGWGQSFHFAVRRPGDTLASAIEEHETWLAREGRLGAGVRAVDLGCGVGGPMRFLARTTGAHITGVNLNRTQLTRARARADAEGLADRIALVQSDFATLPFPDASVDCVYAIEATCHAPDRARVFAEAARVLVPGGRFVGYEWCTTERYDRSNPAHQRVCREIEEGNALPPLASPAEVDAALRAAGLELIEGRDIRADGHPSTPWWMALAGEGGWRALPRTPVGRAVTGRLVRILEALGVAPAGATEVSALLNRAADGLVAGGKLDIFTPMYRWSAVKPG